jgi:hypothetical protein
MPRNAINSFVTDELISETFITYVTGVFFVFFLITCTMFYYLYVIKFLLYEPYTCPQPIIASIYYYMNMFKLPDSLG